MRELLCGNIADSYLKIQNLIVVDKSHGYRIEADMKGKNIWQKAEENMRLILFHKIFLLPQEMLLLFIPGRLGRAVSFGTVLPINISAGINIQTYKYT